MENKLRHHHRLLLLQCCGAAGRCFLRGADPQWSCWTLLTTEVWGLWSWVWESHHLQSDWGRSFKSLQRCAGASPGGSQDRRHWCAIERWNKPERFSPFLHRLCRYLLVWFHSFLNSVFLSVRLRWALVPQPVSREQPSGFLHSTAATAPHTHLRPHHSPSIIIIISFITSLLCWSWAGK